MNRKQAKKENVLNDLYKYAKKWVALTQDYTKVMYSAKTLNELISKSRKDKNLIFSYISPTDGTLSPVCQKL